MMKLHEGVNSEMTVLGRLLKVYEDLLALRRQYLNRLGVIKIANRLFATLDSSKGKPTFEEWAALFARIEHKPKVTEGMVRTRRLNSKVLPEADSHASLMR